MPPRSRAPRAPPRRSSPPRESSPPPERPKWFVGFDCATKTFAFSISYVDLQSFRAARQSLWQRLEALRELARRAGELLHAGDLAAGTRLLPGIREATAALARELGGFIRVLDGETADLCPGRPDKEIPTVERLRALVRYVDGRVRPAMARHLPAGAPRRVLVEYQMEDPMRKISDALVTLFAAEDVIIVGPSLKNSLHTCEEGRYYHFAARYAKTYDANKAHAKFNFRKIEETFGSGIPPCTAAARGHIADSFMQVLGHIAGSDDDETARRRY